MVKSNFIKNKIFFFIWINSNTIFSRNKDYKNHENIKQATLESLKKKSRDANTLHGETYEEGLVTSDGTMYFCGILDELIFEGVPEEIKNNILKDIPIKENEEINWYTLKLIILQLNNIFKTKFVFNVSKVKDSQDRFKITFSRKPAKVYFLKDIIIYNNKLLKTHAIKEVIENIMPPLNIIQKIIYIFSGTNSSMFIGNIQAQNIEYAIKNLSERYLILGTKAKIFYEFHPNTNYFTLHVDIEEGQKYLIDKIVTENFKFSQRILKDILNENGMKDGSFNYLSLILMEEYSIERIGVSYNVSQDKPNLMIFLAKENENKILNVENIQYNVSSIPLKTLIKYNPVRTGDLLDEWKLKYFCYDLSIRFATNITYEIIPCSGDNKIIIKITETKEETKKDIVTVEKAVILQYPINYYTMNLSFTFEPKIALFGNSFVFNKSALLNRNNNETKKSDKSWISAGGSLKITHKFNLHTAIDFADLNIFLNPTFESKKLLKSLQASLLKYFHTERNYNYYITPLSLHKFFNPLTKDHLKDYIYYSFDCHLHKTIKFNHYDEGRLEIKGNFFYESFNGKLMFQPELQKILSNNNKLLILVTLKVLFNSQSYKDKNQIYKHLSAINKKDNIGGLLWDYHNNERESGINKTSFGNKQEDYEDCQNYLYSKDIILSNAIGNLRLMLLYEIFKIKIPNLGPIILYSHIFLNLNYDITHNLLRLSYGFGLMGIVNNVRLFLSTGYCSNLNGKHKEQKQLEEENNSLKYAFNYEPSYA
jgi:hypothetical protein